MCDRDGGENNVRKYKVGLIAGSLYTMELCETCARPLDELIADHEQRSKRTVFKVTPIAEVQKAAKTAQKAATRPRTRR